jgi:protein TonB
MYADRFTQPRRFNPGSMGLAIGINAVVLAGLVFSTPVVEKLTDGAIVVYTPHDEPPPPPKPLPTPQPQPRANPAPEHIETVNDPIVDVTRPAQGPILIDIGPATGTLEGTGTDPVKVDPAPPPPMLIGAKIDPRYADALQPAYPASERRAGREGTVEVRVLIGLDGRVREVQRVSATSDAFFEATRRQALGHWRFEPATRGGVPQESWKKMSIRFVLSN